MKCASSIILVGLSLPLLASAAFGQAVDVPKTNPMKVYMHYMPWFDTPATLGGNQWGWHWTMNNQNPNIVDSTGKRQIASHFYPLIGPYASSDQDVIEYHMLLMKYSGVDGVVLDWYGQQGTNGDINSLLTNSNAIVSRTDDFGLDFGVVMEDRFSANISQASANVAYLRDHYFNQSNYIRAGSGNDPLLMVFGPITFQQQSDWTQILSNAGGDVDFLTLWYESGDAGTNADGEYAWIYEDENLDDHLARQSNFDRFRTPSLGTAGGVAYPGFDDFYQEGGAGPAIPFEIPYNDGQTLADVLSVANQYSNNIDFLQLATFNDYGEGTMFEPTIETGFDYLHQIQQFTGTPYGEDELELIFRLYRARKKYAGDTGRQASLNEVSTDLAELQVNAAIALLDSVAPLGDYDGDGDVDENDFLTWRASFGTTTVAYGTGADGNADGVVDARDYVVWRDSMTAYGSGGGASVSNAPVPEPTSLALVYCATLVWFVTSRP
jgi:Glycosyl hydrolase family 99/Dockerin type I domain